MTNANEMTLQRTLSPVIQESTQEQTIELQAITEEDELSKHNVMPDPMDRDPVYIQKWIDYSQKYGLIYQLSDETVGVIFNDTTKITNDPINPQQL